MTKPSDRQPDFKPGQLVLFVAAVIVLLVYVWAHFPLTLCATLQPSGRTTHLPSLSRNDKLNKENKTAHNDYDGQTENGAAIIWMCAREQNGFDWYCSNILARRLIGTLTYINASTLLSRGHNFG